MQTTEISSEPTENSLRNSTRIRTPMTPLHTKSLSKLPKPTKHSPTPTLVVSTINTVLKALRGTILVVATTIPSTYSHASLVDPVTSMVGTVGCGRGPIWRLRLKSH